MPSGTIATKEKQCAALEDRWREFQKLLDERHEACLKKEDAEASLEAHQQYIRSGQAKPTLAPDKEAACSRRNCQGLHTLLFGNKLSDAHMRQTKACKENVQRFKEFSSKNQEQGESRKKQLEADYKQRRQEPPLPPSWLDEHAESLGGAVNRTFEYTGNRVDGITGTDIGSDLVATFPLSNIIKQATENRKRYKQLQEKCKQPGNSDRCVNAELTWEQYNEMLQKETRGR
jgi:hypothetical protein